MLDLKQKLALCADNGAENITCSASLKDEGGTHIGFTLSRAELCHILDCVQIDSQETVARKMVKLYGDASRSIEVFDAILARFVRKFGQDRIRFQVYEYLDRFGICIRRGTSKSGYDQRIAITFRDNERIEAVDAAIRFAEKWDAGETEHKGKANGEVLEGSEISAQEILAGDVN